MSSKIPDKYRGSYNSDKYEIERGSLISEEYANRENNIGSMGPLNSNNFGGTSEGLTVEEDDEYYKEVYSLYSKVLDASGMNLLDPYQAYMTHFNKLQRLNVDPPYGGKTYIFITRPDLNFWKMPTGVHNVETVDLFNYFSKMNIGLSVMPYLMFPHLMPMEFAVSRGNSGNVKSSYVRCRRERIGLTPLPTDEKAVNKIGYTPYTPFIPILSNTCKSSSGGQDLSLEVEETEGDLHGNKLQYAKGADPSFQPGEITLEFNDVWGSPVMHMMNIWVHYIHYLTKGVVVEWEKYLQYRILDYTCSIYIFETDKDNSTILRWAKYTGCFPKSVPLGNIQHNMETDVEHLRNLSIPFVYNRYEAMKPAALVDFNFLMNKFLLDEDRTNRLRIYNQGTAPRKLVLPYSKYNEMTNILGRDSAIMHPMHYEYSSSSDKRSDIKTIVANNSDYYDSKFWGSLPYIMNHKLVWINPKNFYDNFNTINKRSKSVDKFVEGLEEKMINTDNTPKF